VRVRGRDCVRKREKERCYVYEMEKSATEMLTTQPAPHPHSLAMLRRALFMSKLIQRERAFWATEELETPAPEEVATAAAGDVEAEVLALAVVGATRGNVNEPRRGDVGLGEGERSWSCVN
jgi:hypothetical protein